MIWVHMVENDLVTMRLRVKTPIGEIPRAGVDDGGALVSEVAERPREAAASRPEPAAVAESPVTPGRQKWFSSESVDGVTVGQGLVLKGRDVIVGKFDVYTTDGVLQLAMRQHDVGWEPAAPPEPVPVDDARTLSLDLGVGGRRRRQWRDICVQFSPETFADWPVQGPRTTAWCCEFINRRGGGPLDHHRWWLGSMRLGADAWGVSEHEHGLRALDHYGCYDCLDLTHSAGVELMLRRVQMVEYAYMRDGAASSAGQGEAGKKNKGGGKGGRGAGFFDESSVFSGTHRDSGEFMVCPELLDYVSKEVERDASVMKQVRKAREEQRLLHKE